MGLLGIQQHHDIRAARFLLLFSSTNLYGIFSSTNHLYLPFSYHAIFYFFICRFTHVLFILILSFSSFSLLFVTFTWLSVLRLSSRSFLGWPVAHAAGRVCMLHYVYINISAKEREKPERAFVYFWRGRLVLFSFLLHCFLARLRCLPFRQRSKTGKGPAQGTFGKTEKQNTNFTWYLTGRR